MNILCEVQQTTVATFDLTQLKAQAHGSVPCAMHSGSKHNAVITTVQQYGKIPHDSTAIQPYHSMTVQKNSSTVK